MKIRSIFIAIALTCFFSSITFAESPAETLIGTVQIRNSSKLDGQAKKQLAAIAAKIKNKLKSGTVKLIGNVPSAGSPDDFMTKSFFLAKGVESYLKTLLPNRYQVFLTASRHSNDKSGEKNSVSVFLYPYEMKAEGLRFISSQLRFENVREEDSPSVSEDPGEDSTATSSSPAESVPVDSALSSPQRSDYKSGSIKSKKERDKVESEDPIQANDLVNKAKARAAAKAKLKENPD